MITEEKKTPGWVVTPYPAGTDNPNILRLVAVWNGDNFPELRFTDERFEIPNDEKALETAKRAFALKCNVALLKHKEMHGPAAKLDQSLTTLLNDGDEAIVAEAETEVRRLRDEEAKRLKAERRRQELERREYVKASTEQWQAEAIEMRAKLAEKPDDKLAKKLAEHEVFLAASEAELVEVKRLETEEAQAKE